MYLKKRKEKKREKKQSQDGRRKKDALKEGKEFEFITNYFVGQFMA
jgi:hypothetical protein